MHLKLISAQPATNYYAWQVEVYLNNFISNGYDPLIIQVVGCYVDKIPDSWNRLIDRFEDVGFYLYKNDTINLEYAPAIQSYMLKKHWDAHPHLSGHACFFHDADFLFTRHFDFTSFLNDSVWYLSDTISYIGADYIKSKSEDVLNHMCNTVRIKRDVVERNQENSGGAQKLMKNVTSEYWESVYNTSIELYAALKEVAHFKRDTDPHGIQIWTASMWAELWTAWKMGFETRVPKEFDFCWATCHISRWDEVSFFHNAGVGDSKSDMFFKADYIDSYPYGIDIKISKDRCSINYLKAIHEVDSCLV